MSEPHSPFAPGGSSSSPIPGAPSSPGDPQRPPTIGELFAQLSTQVSSLVQGEIELTKARASTFFKRIGAGAALVALAGALSLYLFGWVFHTIEVALRHAVPDWAAALIVVGLLLLVVAVLALVGIKLIQKSQQSTPAPQEGIKQDVDAFRKGLGK